MLSIETQSVQLQKSCEDIFAFFSDINNMKKIMPEQVENWKSDADSCSFTVSGLADVSMRVYSRIIPELIHLKSETKKPFDFDLRILINQSNTHSDVKFQFEAAVNPFLQMMVESPLRNFFQSLADRVILAIG